MLTIAVVNTKGGVGKTTLCAALAVRAAQDNKRVAMVDMDPQKSLVEWWRRRGQTANPSIFEGADTAFDAVERLAMDTTAGAPWDYCFLDGPPAFLTVIEEMIQAADFVLIPVKPSMLDLLSTEDAVSLAQQAGAVYRVVFNDVGPKERIVDKAKEFMFSAQVPMIDTPIVRRAAHINAMTVGKSAAEPGKTQDDKAADEIDRLWKEVRALALKAAKARAKKEPAHG